MNIHTRPSRKFVHSPLTEQDPTTQPCKPVLSREARKGCRRSSVIHKRSPCLPRALGSRVLVLLCGSHKYCAPRRPHPPEDPTAGFSRMYCAFLQGIHGTKLSENLQEMQIKADGGVVQAI